MKNLLFVLLSLPFISFSQGNVIPDSTKYVQIELKDGTTLKGKITAQQKDEISLQTPNLGIVQVSIATIDNIKEVENAIGFDNPHSTRYYWAPSAFNLKKGEGYYQNAYLLLNSVNYGITDNFSMGAGFIFNPTFKDWQILFFTPKFSFQAAPKIRVGGGAIVVAAFTKGTFFNSKGSTTSKGYEPITGGILYGNTTLGSKNNNATLGLGWGFGNKEISSTPVVNLNFMKSIARKISFISENWLVTQADNNDFETMGVGSAGVRLFGDRLAVDLALIVPFSTNGDFNLIAIPFVGFVYKFKKKTRKFTTN